MKVKTDLELWIELRDRLQGQFLANKLDLQYFEGKNKSFSVSVEIGNYYRAEIAQRKVNLKLLGEEIPMIDEEIEKLK